MWVGYVGRDGYSNGFSFLVAILVFCVCTKLLKLLRLALNGFGFSRLKSSRNDQKIYICKKTWFHVFWHDFSLTTRVGPTICTTKGDACVCVCAKLDQFLPVRSHFDTKRPVNCFHIATFPSPTFGPLFAFHCPLFFTKNNNLHAAMF